MCVASVLDEHLKYALYWYVNQLALVLFLLLRTMQLIFEIFFLFVILSRKSIKKRVTVVGVKFH